jgi:phospholipid/cholesterol/gamma-HCH transport system substrate-binding protein
MPADYHRKATLLFVAALCVAALAAGFWYLRFLAQYTTYRILTHDSISGLIVDSPVEFHGVEVGNVRKIELIDPRTVSIDLRVAKGTPVSKATVATVTSRGLAARGFTGYVYVALENTSAESGPLTIASGERFPVIATAPSVADTMDTTVADATQQVRVLVRLLRSVLDDKTIVALKQSLDGFQHVIGTLATNKAELGSLVVNADRDSRDIGRLLDAKSIASLKVSIDGLQKVMGTLAENDDRLNSLIANAESASREIRPLLETLAENDERLGSLIVNTERDSREIRPLLETSNDTLGELHDVLPRLSRSLENLNGLTRTLDGLAEKIARDPSTVIRGTVTLPGPGER